MQIRKALANFALKALNSYNPLLGAGAIYNFGSAFTWLNGSGLSGYDNKIVYSGMNLLVSKLVEAPILVSKIENKKALKGYYKTSNNEERAKNKALALTEIEGKHPLKDLLTKPNDYQTYIELMDQFWHNWLFGDGYLVAVDEGGVGMDSRKYQPTKIYAVNRDRIAPQKSKEDFKKISHYILTLNNGNKVELPLEKVFHMSKWNPMQQIEGYGVMNAAGRTVSKDIQGEIAQGAAFANGGRGTMVTAEVFEKNGDIVEQMSYDQMQQIKDTMIYDMAGARNYRKISFSNRKLNVQNYGDTLAEMELIEAGKSNWKDVYTVLRIPIVLGPTAEAMTESNVIAGYKALVTNTVVPDIRRFDEKFNAWVQPWFGSDIVAVHDLTEYAELTPDYKLLKEIYGDAPYLTPNEKRKLFNFDTDEKTEGMNTYFFPSGLRPLSQVMSDPFIELDNLDNQKNNDYRN